jgi:hypothetical protein
MEISAHSNGIVSYYFPFNLNDACTAKQNKAIIKRQEVTFS